MYVLQCPGGYPIPAKKGKFEVWGFSAPVSNTGLDSRLAIVDDINITDTEDTGFVLGTLTDAEVVLADAKGLASADTVLSVIFPDVIKTRHGISIFAQNVVAGSVCLYVS